VQQAENVITVREREIAERAKAVQLIKATEEAEKDAIDIKVAAQAEKQAAADRAEAVRIEAQGQADKKRLTAQGEADAQLLIAQAQAEQYRVEAEGQEAINTAANMLSPDQIDMQIRMALLERLPAIIAESVKPIENIDGIKILQIGGNGAGMLGQGNGGGSSTGNSDGGSKGSLADDMVNSALRYRSQAPLIDHLLGELGLAGGGDINALTGALVDSQFSPVGKKGTSKRAQARQATRDSAANTSGNIGDAGASIHSLDLPDPVSKRVNKAIDKAEESTDATVNHIKYQQPTQQSNAPQTGPTTRTVIQPAHKTDE